MSYLCPGRVERVTPESKWLQPNNQAAGAEVHPLPSSGECKRLQRAAHEALGAVGGHQRARRPREPGGNIPSRCQALMETALTRVVLPMPILLLPPLIMSMLEKLPVLQRQRRLVLPVHSLVCLAAFVLALPLAISLFPQMSQISVNRLEPEIAMATDGLMVTYNKGL